MRTIIIADNQYITSFGLNALLQDLFINPTIEKAQNVESLKTLLRIYPSAMIILDYTLFDFESPFQLLNLRASVPNSSWILFSDEIRGGLLRSISKCEDFSIVLKQDSSEDIINTMKLAWINERFICSYIQRLLNEQKLSENPKEKLTQSEKKILRYIALGKSTKEIASELNLSFHTINTHRKNIFRKIEVNNVHEAIRYAVRSGIADTLDYYL